MNEFCLANLLGFLSSENTIAVIVATGSLCSRQKRQSPSDWLLTAQSSRNHYVIPKTEELTPKALP